MGEQTALYFRPRTLDETIETLSRHGGQILSGGTEVVSAGATDLGAQIYWFLPVRLLSRLDYDSARNLREIRAPIFIAHSRDDDVIPFAHGRALYELAAGPKVFLEMHGGHNEGFVFSRPEWSAQLAAFLDRYPAR